MHPFYRNVILVLSFVAFALQVNAQAPADPKKQTEDYLKETRNNLLAQLKGVTPEQFKFKAGPDRWSIAEVCEHIIISEGEIRKMAEGILKSPAMPEKRAEIKMNFDMIKAGVTNRDEGHRRQTMDALKPSGKFATVSDAIKAFKEARKATEEALEHASLPDLQNHIGQVGPLGTNDALAGFTFLAAHSARHTKQIEEVKASAGYPKGK